MGWDELREERIKDVEAERANWDNSIFHADLPLSNLLWSDNLIQSVSRATFKAYFLWWALIIHL